MPADTRRFVVQHRDRGVIRGLGDIIGGFAHFTALDPFLAHLPPGATGELVLVDADTGTVAARRSLRYGSRPGRWFSGRRADRS
jgi:hypothetical protein